MKKHTLESVLKILGVNQIEFILYNKEGEEFDRRLCVTNEQMKEESGSIVREHGKSVWSYMDRDNAEDNRIFMHTGFGIMPGWIAKHVEQNGTIAIDNEVTEIIH